MQPVMEPVFNTLPAGELLLRTAKKVGGALARFTAPSYKAHLQSRWQALASQHGRARLRRLLARCTAAGRRLCSGTGPRAGLAGRGRGPDQVHPAQHSKGTATSIFVAVSSRHAVRRPRRQQAVAAGKRRSGHQDHLAFLGRDPSRHCAQSWTCATARSCGSPRPTAPIEAPAYIYAGVHPDVVAMPLGFGHTEYGAVRSGSRGECARSAGRAGRTISALRLDPG